MSAVEVLVSPKNDHEAPAAPNSQSPKKPAYRIFVDEVGNHDLKSCDDPRHRYLGLTGIIVGIDAEHHDLAVRLDDLKQQIFGTTEVVLHRREIIDRTPPFDVLCNEEISAKFDALLLGIIDLASYRAFTVVIDKLEHRQRYALWRFHPYHYCLTVMLERYVQWLERHGLEGDVLAESRGKKENMQLASAYRYIYRNGSDHVDVRVFQARLTSKEIKISPKSANEPGLQLADLIANPACRQLICARNREEMTAEYGKKIVEILYKKKYLRNPYSLVIPGWGVKWLP